LIIGLRLDGLDDAINDVGIVQKVLAEAFTWSVETV